MPTTTTNPIIQHGLEALSFARSVTNEFIEDIPETEYTHQSAADGTHVLWILGHLANTDDWFLSNLGGGERKTPESWDAMFGMKSTVSTDPSAYPPIAEVRAAFEERRAAAREWFASLDDTQLAEPLADELKPFASCRGVLMSTIAAHECMHSGQISAIRRSLGIPRKF